MPLKLHLLRHAQSADKQQGQGDFDRLLTPQGREDATRLGQASKKMNINFDLILSSTAERAKSTAMLVCEGVGYPGEHVAWLDTLYEASLHHLVQVIRQLPPNAQSVLIVGHNPTISETVIHLTGESGGDLPPCGIAAIEFSSNDWKSVRTGSGKLLYVSSPLA